MPSQPESRVDRVLRQILHPSEGKSLGYLAASLLFLVTGCIGMAKLGSPGSVSNLMGAGIGAVLGLAIIFAFLAGHVFPRPTPWVDVETGEGDR